MGTVTYLDMPRQHPLPAHEPPDLDMVVQIAPIEPAGQVEALLARAGLTRDASSVWLAYPNLKAAAEAAMAELSVHWPVRTRAGGLAFAVEEGVCAGLRRVRRGLEDGQASRAEVVGSFLNGLADTVAPALAGTRVHGRVGTRWPAEYRIDSWSFPAWAAGVDSVGFALGEKAAYTDLEGMRTHLLCHIATARDVGLAAVHRWLGDGKRPGDD